MNIKLSLPCLFLIAACGCQSSPGFFAGTGKHHRAVTTASPAAQRYFDQGLIFLYGFNHDEAIRSFTEAASLDSGCAMAWWGIALANGMHYNNTAMDGAHSKAAWDALEKAVALLDGSTPAERALIEALAKRYANPPPADRKPLDAAYADAMRGVWNSNRSDADIGALFAESLMNLRPWDLWQENGSPQPGTEEILAVLEEALRIDPFHPGANHYYIHAVEASPKPDRGVVAAERLRSLVPAAGHLVHMPSHIDVRTGNWAKAAEANEKAIEADRVYRQLSPEQGFYHVYMAHNYHFLAFASMMEGRSQAGIKAAREMIAGVPREVIESQPAMVDPVMSIALDVLKRYGRWDDILNEPPPSEKLPITSAIWRFSRGVAQAAKWEVGEAEKELAAFREAVKKVPEDAKMAINPAHKVLAIADRMLAGEIAFRAGRADEAVALLSDGVKLEDGLTYMEPPDWIQPVRHTLGAVLLTAGKAREAEQVYRDDLKRWPENGWSLLGLAEALKARGEAAEEDAVRKRFEKAWSRADFEIGSSCLCISKTR